MGKSFFDTHHHVYFDASNGAADAFMAHLHLLEDFVGCKSGFDERAFIGEIWVEPDQMHLFAKAMVARFSAQPGNPYVHKFPGEPAKMHRIFQGVYKGAAVLWMAIYHAAFDLPRGADIFAEWRVEAVLEAETSIRPRFGRP